MAIPFRSPKGIQQSENEVKVLQQDTMYSKGTACSMLENEEVQ